MIDELTALGIGIIGFCIGLCAFMTFEVLFIQRKTNKKEKEREAEEELRTKITSIVIAELNKRDT